eukprot:CAMPEP_0181313546 /NCGR_PEP_ID=MMETSP1101-20121128/14304_1 /TAXON_ID=46948 /ORGANISM="Rhodomonas abbreviata, Strain Caron Lab Isolate" /LENGTH=238 /DNA_ID=CAMNT_0023420503 /DNA_START=60 /DNA_END=776 /DNA_ORIENTATION=+
MSSFEADPFYTVRDNVNVQIEKLKTRHEKFEHLTKTTDTSTNADFKDTRKTLVKEVRAAEKDLKGLRGAVDMIEKNRAKFPQVQDAELASRRAFVTEAARKIAEVRGGVAVRSKMDQDEQRANAEFNANPMAKDNASFIANQQQQTRRMVEQQDASLDSLGVAVDRLHAIGKDINEEVREQSVLLDGLEQEVDEAAQKMDVVTGSLAKLLKTKDGCQVWTIVILTFILILLIALVVWS